MTRYDEIFRLTERLREEIDALENDRRSAPLPVEELGNLVKTARKEQKLTQDELADLAGVSKGTLKRIEADNRNITFSNVIDVLQTLGMTLWIR